MSGRLLPTMTSGILQRGGRDLKVARPVGQDGTGPDSAGHGAKNRGLATDENGPGRTAADSECKSVSDKVVQVRLSASPCDGAGMTVEADDE